MKPAYSYNSPNLAPVWGIGGLAFHHEGQTYFFRTWMKPITKALAKGGDPLAIAAAAEACRIYVDIYDAKTPPNKWSRKTLVASYRLDKGMHAVLDSAKDTYTPAAQNVIEWFANRVFVGSEPAETTEWERLLGIVNACATNPKFVASLPSVPLLRSLYRTCVGMTGTTYPSKDDMVSRLALLRDLPCFCWSKNDSAFLRQMPRVILDGVTSEPVPVHEGPEVLQTAHDELRDGPDPAKLVDVDSLTNTELVELARESANAQNRYDALREGFENAIARTAKYEEAYAAADSAATDACSEVARLQGEIDAFKRVTVQANPAKVSADGTTVDVLGVTLPRYGCDAAPVIDEGYDLSGWRAAMTVGGTLFEANAAQVAKAIIDGDSVRLIGPPSVGKTSGIRQVAAQCGARFFLIQCGEGANDLTLIGQHTVSEGNMVWQDGSITAAVRWATLNPDFLTLVILDEVDHLQPEVQSLLHGVLEGDLLQFNGEELQVPSNVRFVATANTSGFGDTTGRHSAAKVSDSAFTSRWNVTFDVTYLPPEAEERVLIKAGAPVALAAHAVAVANETRVEGASVSQPIVLRQLLAWSRGCLNQEDPQWAFAWRVLAQMPEHDRPAVWELAKLKFGW